MAFGNAFSGSCQDFTRAIGAKGKDILYVGDHLFADVLKPKKLHGWRTCLIVPEVAQEASFWQTRRAEYDQLQQLNTVLNAKRNNGASKSEIANVKKAIKISDHSLF